MEKKPRCLKATRLFTCNDLLSLLNFPVIIPRRVAEGEVHEELCQFFDDLIPHGMEHGVMVAERIEDDTDHDERELRQGEADLPENSLPWRIADEEIQAEDGHDADADMNRRVKGHFRRAGNETRPHESSRKARMRKTTADGSHMPCVGEPCE